jgi:hypothetical protein
MKAAHDGDIQVVEKRIHDSWASRRIEPSLPRSKQALRLMPFLCKSALEVEPASSVSPSTLR